MSIWATSDFHISHTNIIRYANRPFKSVFEMDEVIIDNLFKTIKSGDTLYYLGDLSFNKESDVRIINMLHKQNIKTFFVIGNHDKAMKTTEVRETIKSCSTFKGMWDLLDEHIENQEVTMCHYPMLTFKGSHFNAWQLYGHHHSDISAIATGKKLNVCVDHHDFKPWSWEQIVEYMARRPDNWDKIPDEKIRKREVERNSHL
jgi:calcineurin-like phosphoesterase family protein